MKIQKGSGITPFGGINFVLEEFERLGIGQLLQEQLSSLYAQSRYSWKDLIYSFWSVIFCGGDCIEDVGGNFRTSLSKIPWMKIPSPDRILSRFKELSEDKEYLSSPKGKMNHEFSANNKLFNINLMLLAKLTDFTTSASILDYDNTIIFNNKADAKFTYQQAHGYCPGVGILDGNVVFIENRNGNCDAKTLQDHTLELMFSGLCEQRLSVKAFRADRASYQLEVIEIVDRYVDKFYIKAKMSEPVAQAINSIVNWVDIGAGRMQGDTLFTPFIRTSKRLKRKNPPKAYRLVVTKELRDDKQINMFTQEACNYASILTSDHDMSNEEILWFYNQRGAIEKEFDILKNDFSWNKMPFSKLEQNTVFLYLSAICRNLYRYIITVFSSRFKGLKVTDRLKKFIFRFVAMPVKWIRHARQDVLKIYGNLQLRE